jgi:hypothetical protein
MRSKLLGRMPGSICGRRCIKREQLATGSVHLHGAAFRVVYEYGIRYRLEGCAQLVRLLHDLTLESLAVRDIPAGL